MKLEVVDGGAEPQLTFGDLECGEAFLRGGGALVQGRSYVWIKTDGNSAVATDDGTLADRPSPVTPVTRVNAKVVVER
jgi:hypothetical protein